MTRGLWPRRRALVAGSAHRLFFVRRIFRSAKEDGRFGDVGPALSVKTAHIRDRQAGMKLGMMWDCSRGWGAMSCVRPAMPRCALRFCRAPRDALTGSGSVISRAGRSQAPEDNCRLVFAKRLNHVERLPAKDIEAGARQASGLSYACRAAHSARGFRYRRWALLAF